MLRSAMALVVLAAVGAAAAAAPASIRPGVTWNDTDGNLIDAHGGGLLLHAGRYYWYGSRRTLAAPGTQHDGGIAPEIDTWMLPTAVTLSPSDGIQRLSAWFQICQTPEISSGSGP